MSFLYSYMTESEHAAAVEQAQFENTSMKFDHALECLWMEHTVRVNNIDTEAVVKEYTEEDLENLYTTEMALFMEGVKDLWENFKKWIANIVNKILGKKNEQAEAEAAKADEEVNVDYDPKQVVGILDKAKGIFAKITDVKAEGENGGIDLKKLGVRLGIGAAATGGVLALLTSCKKKDGETVKVKKSFLKSMLDSIRGKVKEVKGAVDSQPAPNEGDQNSVNIFKMLKEFGTSVLNWAGSIINSFRTKLTGGADSDTKPDSNGSEPDKTNSTAPGDAGKPASNPSEGSKTEESTDESESGDAVFESTNFAQNLKELLDLTDAL